MLFFWRPSKIAFALQEESSVAPRDAGWFELWSQDGDRRYGRGHLMIWPTDSASLDASSAPGTDVAESAAQPVGDGAPTLRAELRSFTFDGDAPSPGDGLVVRPETEPASYPVVVREVDVAEPNGTIALDWPDEQLPTSLTELGGY